MPNYWINARMPKEEAKVEKREDMKLSQNRESKLSNSVCTANGSVVVISWSLSTCQRDLSKSLTATEEGKAKLNSMPLEDEKQVKNSHWFHLHFQTWYVSFLFFLLFSFCSSANAFQFHWRRRFVCSPSLFSDFDRKWALKLFALLDLLGSFNFWSAVWRLVFVSLACTHKQSQRFAPLSGDASLWWFLVIKTEKEKKIEQNERADNNQTRSKEEANKSKEEANKNWFLLLLIFFLFKRN